MRAANRRMLSLAVLLAASAPAVAGSDCQCRANGVRYDLGHIMCIMGKLSQCQMNQNVSAWKTIAPDCPEVELLTPRPKPQSLAQLIR